jgi:hypothetical protein
MSANTAKDPDGDLEQIAEQARASRELHERRLAEIEAALEGKLIDLRDARRLQEMLATSEQAAKLRMNRTTQAINLKRPPVVIDPIDS